MARQETTLDPIVLQAVQARLRPGEVVFDWYERPNELTVHLIDEQVKRKHEETLRLFGIGFGSGRSLVFDRQMGTWCFRDEAYWIS